VRFALSDGNEDHNVGGNLESEQWLKSFFGLAFLDPSDVEDCFEDDIMRVLPEDPRCTSFADYILENYIVPDSRFPPTLWSSLPSLNAQLIEHLSLSQTGICRFR
jgi:hypothetical protein